MRNIFLLLFIIPAYAFSQVTDTALAKALLWKVKGQGLATPSYLYGTTHVVCREDIHFSDSLLLVLESAGQMFTEFEPSPANELVYTDKVVNLKGSTLKRLMGKKTFRKISDELSRTMPVNDERLNKWRPHYVGYLLVKQVYNCRVMAYDDSLVNLAIKMAKPVYGLESAKEHFALLPPTILSAETESLFRLMNNLKEQRLAFARHLEANLALYNSKDISRVQEQASFSNGMKIEFSKKVLDERNKRWIPVMEKAMKENAIFFVFGCAHLARQKGVISLLREKGYTVTPLFY